MPRFHFPAVTFRPAMALSYVLLLMAAELCQLNTSTWWDPLVSIPFNVLFYAAWIWLLFYIVGLLPRCVRMAVHTVLHVTLAAYTVSTAFLVYFFHRHWDAFSLQFVHEANSRETSEFVANYVLSFPTFFLLIMLVAWGAAEWWASRRWGTWPMMPRNRAARMVMGAGCLLMWGQVLFFSPDAYRNYDLVVRFHTPVKRNATWTFWQSVLQYRESQAEFERCALTLKNYDEHVTAEEPEADLVLIIGESFNRHMSNLYDGPYNTNPLLRQREQSGRLFLMKDVISSSNNTTENFKYFLSMASVADPQRWCDAPLLPALLKRAGYRVTYFSNQFAPNDALGEWDASMGYINHPSIEPYIFDRRNTSKYPLDLSLVGDFAQQAQQLMAPKRNFCIFHLYGQHMMASRRYPASEAPFSASDVSNRYALPVKSGRYANLNARLSDEQRSEVAHYLNATRYNDLVVDSIIRLFDHRNAIVIYFSDHGEEVHNFRAQYCRTDLLTDKAPQALRQQLDVPFMVYLTPRYAQLHPQLPARLRRAASLRFMTDDLPQAICDLLGVRSHYYRPERSPFSDSYRQPAHRILQNGRRYD